MSLHPYESLYDTDLLAYTILHNGLTEQGLKLKKGDKVKLTKWGEYSLIHTKKTKGVVVGHTRDNRGSIRVRLIGNKSVYSYWPGFWQKELQ